MGSIRRDTKITIRLAQLAVFVSLLGRGLLYLIWDGPLRELLWDESIMSPFVAKIGYTWSEWATSLYVEQSIQWTVWVLGVMFLLLALTTLWVHQSKRLAQISLPLAAILALIHTLLSAKSHFYRPGYFIEMSLQWVSPLLLLLLLRQSFTLKVDYFFRVVIALTFIGHGLYAVGYYPVPGNFQDMMMNSFGVDRSRALNLLKLAGILDFLAALLLLIPYKKWAVWGLYYIIIWGILTTFARLWSYLDLVSLEGLVLHWLPETMIRVVHFLMPIVLLLLWQKKLPLRYSPSNK
jgi:hypothetical protein